jgi:cell division protein FtsB
MKHGGSRTSTIPRPPAEERRQKVPVRGRSDDTRLIQRTRSRAALGIGAIVIVLALGAALLVLPFKTWLRQREEIGALTRSVTAVQAANDHAEHANDALNGPEGVQAAARADLGYQKTNEQILAALPPPQLPTQLPDNGWPYSLVSQILSVRTVAAMQAATAGAATTGGEIPNAATTTIDAFPG